MSQSGHQLPRRPHNDQGGQINDDQEKYCRDAAILSLLRDEHVLVIGIAQKHQHMLESILKKAGKGSVNAACNLLDSASVSQYISEPEKFSPD
ncbi:MAG: hypothetical protein HC934_11190 [Acaryochloridaceae cyanobacterium SU_2_1]|nr:hypothetical protein [Acaryochloridaceae cyanobacterium SU_2_1]